MNQLKKMKKRMSTLSMELVFRIIDLVINKGICAKIRIFRGEPSQEIRNLLVILKTQKPSFHKTFRSNNSFTRNYGSSTYQTPPATTQESMIESMLEGSWRVKR